MPLRRLAHLLAGLMVLGGCPDAGEEGALDAGRDKPGSEDAGGTASIGPSGGVFSFHGGRVKLDVPAGALDGDTAIRVVPTTDYPPDPGLVPHTVYDLLPEGVVFKKPVKLTIAFKGPQVPKGVSMAALRIHKVVSKAWQAQPGGVDLYGWTAWTELKGFSKYGVKGPKPLSVDTDMAIPSDGPVSDTPKPDAHKPSTTPWVVAAGGPGSDSGRDIVVDGKGNYIVTGVFSGKASFGKTTLSSVGSEDVFVAKVDPKGAFIWAVSAGSSKEDKGNAVAVDSSGNIFITGTLFDFTGGLSITVPATFGTLNVQTKPWTMFVAKLDPNGKFLWVKLVRLAWGQGVAVAGSGHILLTGTFFGITKFGTIPLSSTNATPNSGSEDPFVARLDQSGKFLWAVSGGGDKIDACNDIAVDGGGNAIITGGFGGTATFGTTTLSANSSGSASLTDVFVAKLDKNGKYAWAISTGSKAHEQGYSVAVDKQGNSYVTGNFYYTVQFGTTSLSATANQRDFVAKLDKAGKFVWARKLGGPARAIAVDGAGNGAITGTFSGAASFGAITLTCGKHSDLYMAKLDSTGKVSWAVPAGGIYGDTGYGVTLDGLGQPVVTGHYNGTASFGANKLQSKGGTDVFVARPSATWSSAWPKLDAGPPDTLAPDVLSPDMYSTGCVTCCGKCSTDWSDCLNYCYTYSPNPGMCQSNCDSDYYICKNACPCLCF